MDGIDDYFARVRDSGAEIASDLEDNPWGFREFVMRTNEGHRIAFAQRLQGQAP
jgi:uncharacterized glyoxalase superfamily protein PhnB